MSENRASGTAACPSTAMIGAARDLNIVSAGNAGGHGGRWVFNVIFAEPNGIEILAHEPASLKATEMGPKANGFERSPNGEQFVVEQLAVNVTVDPKDAYVVAVGRHGPIPDLRISPGKGDCSSTSPADKPPVEINADGSERHGRGRLEAHRGPSGAAGLPLVHVQRVPIELWPGVLARPAKWDAGTPPAPNVSILPLRRLLRPLRTQSQGT